MKATIELKRWLGQASLLAVLSIALIYASSCAGDQPAAGAGQPTISELISNPAAYIGNKVTLSGEYRGWEAGHGSPPVTRSDWVLKDATGAIYVTGKSPAGLDPVKDLGKGVTVEGVVRSRDGRAYIEAVAVKQP